MKNKTRVITRIIACLLALIIALGLIIPAVSAATPLPGEPTGSAPSGFEFVQKEDGSWEVVKYQDNTAPAVMLYGQPEIFDTIAVTVFIGNLVTGEVKTCTLAQYQAYIHSLELENGYYVIYADEYAWSDRDGDTYSVLPDQGLYFYVGESGFDANLFPEFTFVTDHTEIMQLPVSTAINGAQVVSYNSQLTLSPIGLSIPEKYMPTTQDPGVEDPGQEDPNNPEDPTVDPGVTETQPNEEPTEKPIIEEKSFGEIVFGGLKSSIFMIIAIAACWIGLKIMQARKASKIAEQSMKDHYDDKRLK